MHAVHEVPAMPPGTGARRAAWPLNVLLALTGAIALRYVLGLSPLWWMAWLAPLPLSIAVARAGRVEAVLLATMAGVIGATAISAISRSSWAGRLRLASLHCRR